MSSRNVPVLPSWGGYIDVVRLLMDHGADLEAKDAFGRTPLTWTSIYGKIDVVKLLLNRGADIEGKDGYGRTSLSVASSRGRIDVVRLLLDRGADAGSKDNLGRTPLIYASMNHQLDVVRVLVAHGNLEAKNNEGDTFISYLPEEQKEEAEKVIEDIHNRRRMVKPAKRS